jgi:hypothetical protein
MPTADNLRREIAAERARQGGRSEADLVALIESGAASEALTDLVFFTAPSAFPARAEDILSGLAGSFPSGDGPRREHILLFLTDMVKWLRSFLPRWNLQDRRRHGRDALADDQVQAIADAFADCAGKLETQDPAATARLLAMWRSESAARFQAEAAEEPQVEAERFVGSTISEYLGNISRAIMQSNLRRIAEMRFAGENGTEISNDYAAHLRYALFLGASFVTCNPPLIDMAWTADPGQWNPIVDAILAAHRDGGADEWARFVTLEFVLANMRLLRPIFLLTDGEMGCVCLQVNPHHHADGRAMVEDARFFYSELRRRLDGGVPNVVFKLPGTLAGLEACRALTSEGIGVTITVNFGLFQHLRFAEAIREGQAIFSTLVEMNGRLAYPVRDELLAKIDALADHGIDETRAREAAAWSALAVLKRLQRMLRAHGYDLKRVKPLTASHRIYGGKVHRTLPNPLLDVSEAVGTGIITVFPNIRRAFDALPALALSPRQIESPVPDEALEVLTHSEIFKQAYYVDEPAWAEADEARFRPEHVLHLEDVSSTAEWPPVRNTLTEFCERYDRFVQRIEGRRRLARIRESLSAPWTSASVEEISLREALVHFDVPTVRETLDLLIQAPARPQLLSALECPEVRRAIEAAADGALLPLYGQALEHHAGTPRA